MLGKIVLLMAALVLVIGAMVIFLQPVGISDNLKVTVIDSSSANPLEGVLVRVYDSQGDFVTQGTSGADGVASFSVGGGNYEVMASPTGYEKKEKMISVSSGKQTKVKIYLPKESSLPSCVESWSCDSWGECVGGVQIRFCTDKNKCGTVSKKPPTTQKCEETGCVSDIDCDKGNCFVSTCREGLCFHVFIEECKNGDGCCPPNCDKEDDSDCGQAGTICSEDDDCITASNCIEGSCLGGFCVFSPLKKCVGGDGCCPSNCDSSSDSDCVTTMCSFDAECYDNDGCTKDECVGGSCKRTTITTCLSSKKDGCCPSNCDANNDADCGTCETNEDCDDENSCTDDRCMGSPKRCSNPPIITCGLDDSCCPLGCTNEQSSEYYDPDCTQAGCRNTYDCDDDDPCTEDICDFYTLTCSHEDITECQNSDGCCPDGCTFETDTDCSVSFYCDTDQDCIDAFYGDPCFTNIHCLLPEHECMADWVECGEDDGCCPQTCYLPENNPDDDPDCAD